MDDVEAARGDDRPAIGLIARPVHADAVYRTILRARDRGFDVFVTHDGREDTEVVRFAEQLGAHVVAPPEASAPQEALERTLSRVVRTAGHPGIVFQAVSCPRIDYERTMAAYEADGFEVRAVSAEDDQSEVAIGVPAYNAESTIADVVREASAVADLVLVVDDGSDDETAVRAREAGATVVVHPRNRGYGGALKTLFEEAHRRQVEQLVTLDADGQHDPRDVPKLVAAQREHGGAVVIGSRYAIGSTTRVPIIRSVGLGIVNLLTNLSMGRFAPSRWVRDTQSGFRVYDSEALASLVDATDIGDGMWASTDIMYCLDNDGFDFAEVGTTIRYDVDRSSTEGAFSHGFGLVKNILGFLEHTHPLVLVGIPGVLSVAIGLMLATWGVQLLIAGGVSIPLLLAGGLFSVSGIVLLLLAAMFHAFNTHPVFTRQRGLKDD